MLLRLIGSISVVQVCINVEYGVRGVIISIVRYIIVSIIMVLFSCGKVWLSCRKVEENISEKNNVNGIIRINVFFFS